MRPVTDLERRVAPFKVESDYQPSGDQPAAIDEITSRIKGGVEDVVLLGATGTGKTATVAWDAGRGMHRLRGELSRLRRDMVGQDPEGGGAVARPPWPMARAAR